MAQVKTITSKLETIFKSLNSLSSTDYNKVIFNIELLKKHHFKKRFKNAHTTLYEAKTFKAFIKGI